jgi:glyoxylase-like metal-dependent hydrolase (beta-lactamase superfamily II)/8-oxo-dGTP pyrophosphatase MutT (NUDIX family)
LIRAWLTIQRWIVNEIVMTPSTSGASMPPARSMQPRPAATIILARDAAHGVEVLMQRRASELAFAGGAYVFPGGSLDAADGAPSLLARCIGIEEAAAQARLATREPALPYYVAAIRECFEESGVLLARHASGASLAPDRLERLASVARPALLAGEVTFEQIVHDFDLMLALDRCEYLAHWTTQAGRPRRFTTRFFVASVPPNQEAIHDHGELVDTVWLSARAALAAYERGEMEMLFPTYKTLREVQALPTAAAMVAFARDRTPLVVGPPIVALTREGPRTVFPGDFSYAEVTKLTASAGAAACEIVPGEPVLLAPGVRRLTAPNPGMMTGPGTNTYLLTTPSGAIAVIDPGPALDEHIQRIVEVAGGPVRWILCTHTHVDHSPGAAPLHARTNAVRFGRPAPEHGSQDRTFAPEHVVVDNERLDLDGLAIRVLHTPGHASNQVCFLLEAERILFTGDHLMQGSTVVINPPDGDMHTYLQQLERLLAEDLHFIAPGHGFLMGEPHEAAERVILHRLLREKKVVAALREFGPAREQNLLPVVYNDTPEKLHGMAARSLLAHLTKLRRDGRATEQSGLWALVD